MKFSKGILNFVKFRRYCTHQGVQGKILQNDGLIDNRTCIPEPDHNVDFLCNPANRDAIFENIKKRRSKGDIDRVLELKDKPGSEHLLSHELSRIPNCTHPDVLKLDKEPNILKVSGEVPKFNFTPVEFENFAVKMKLLKTDGLGPVSGQKSYVFLGDLAELEDALVNYSLVKLRKHGFNLVTVPDILPTKVIERCGLIVDGNRTLVYELDSCYGDDYSLSGTAEMSLAFKMMNTTLDVDKLPLKLAAVSRCYRAESSSLAQERGIYRVHYFTKVEMFICSEHNNSEEVFDNLRAIQEDLFSDLGLHYKVLDMPPHELGAPAYRKIDIEGWMAARQLFGELSSCSNCTDFQSRRLNIKYKTQDERLHYVHTLNGTACALPRMLIALCETNQLRNGTIAIPEKLQPFMKGKSVIYKQPIPNMKLNKHKQKFD